MARDPGIPRPGDEIISFNGREIGSARDLWRTVSRSLPGRFVEIRVDRPRVVRLQTRLARAPGQIRTTCTMPPLLDNFRQTSVTTGSPGRPWAEPEVRTVAARRDFGSHEPEIRRKDPPPTRKTRNFRPSVNNSCG